MKTIGLCGGSGSGKGAVGKLFEMHGIPVIDTDAVYHEITSGLSECLSELVSFFGESIIDDKGALDRGALGKIVFSQDAEQKLAELNRITHKHILSNVRLKLSDIKASGIEYAVVDAPLLFESGFNKECDVIVAVIADKNLRIERVMARDGISRDAAVRRISSQLSDEFLIENSDFVIYNSASLSELAEKIEILINEI